MSENTSEVNFDLDLRFRTKKDALAAGYRTQKKWFAAFFTPKPAQQAVVVKGQRFFGEHQVEQVFSTSKGSREIGPLKAGAQSVGKKKFRSVRYDVYRGSDFVFEPKIKTQRKIQPARLVDVLDAVTKLQSTAGKFEVAAKSARQRKDHKRARGFLKRMNNLLELAEIGLRRAINEELVQHVQSKRKLHFYANGQQIFESKVAPPNWMLKEQTATYKTSSQKELAGKRSSGESPTKNICRLMDAVWTVEQFKADPTLDW